MPGPGRYENPHKKRKIYGNYLYKNVGGTFTDEALYRGFCTPSHYPAIELEKIKDRCPKFKYNKPNNDGALTNRIGKIPKNDDPGCCNYKDNEAFYKTTFCERTIKWPLNKAKRITHTCE